MPGGFQRRECSLPQPLSRPRWTFPCPRISSAARSRPGSRRRGGERTLTQRQLADLGHSTQQNISRYEKGYIPDSWFLLGRLHAEKAIDLNWLLGSFATLSNVPTEAGIANAAAPAAGPAVIGNSGGPPGAEAAGPVVGPPPSAVGKRE